MTADEQAVVETVLRGAEVSGVVDPAESRPRASKYRRGVGREPESR